MQTFLVRWVLLVSIQLWGLSTLAQESELTAYPNAVLVPHGSNDGDSFFVQAGGEEFHVRLYFADCPERDVFQTHDARRVQEQARYFGLENPERVMWLGEQSSGFTKEVLAKPFTLYTSHAKALGGATSKRIYAFVVTSTGRDLAELLVENGLARNFGVKRQRYDGISHTEVEMRLRDMEISAMLANRGIWQESNPDKIVEFRALQRTESDAMEAIMTSSSQILEQPLDINSASQRDLERIPGVGPVTASRILSNRPYASIDDLKTVPGIGEKTFNTIRPYIRLAEPTASNG